MESGNGTPFNLKMPRSSRGLGRCPFTAVTRVQIPYAVLEWSDGHEAHQTILILYGFEAGKRVHTSERSERHTRKAKLSD